jgi:uncharacterized protein
MNLEQKIDIVKDILKDKKVAIGFSGGADSTLIAYLSSKFAEDTLAITIDNHLMPTGFIEHTKSMTDLFGIKHKIIDIDFYEDADFLENRPDRCHTCRNLMYSQIENAARKKGFDYICDGNNISDLVIDRPGILITYAKGFNTPLIEARLTSKEIHEYLNENGIPYSRSTTCLATRIPTNTPTTKEKIERISRCEDYILKNTDCEIIKVRDFEEFCICETDDISKIMNNDKFKQINDELNRQGYKKVALNLSQIDDDEDIVLDYHEGSFSYPLPFGIDIEASREFFENAEVNEKEIVLENISVNENGLISGNEFENYENALNAFMDVLTKIRRKKG